MCLCINSDTSFASTRNARSRVGGFFYLSSHPSKIPKHHDPPLNSPIFVLYRIMKMVLSSAEEAEYGGIFINTKEGVPIRTTLQELGHNQPKTGTPLKTDNSTAHGIVYNKVRQKNRVVLTRDSIGYAIVPNKANSTYTGNQVLTTKQTTSLNTTPLPYTEKCARRTYTYRRTQHPHCEGVVIKLVTTSLSTNIRLLTSSPLIYTNVTIATALRGCATPTWNASCKKTCYEILSSKTIN